MITDQYRLYPGYDHLIVFKSGKIYSTLKGRGRFLTPSKQTEGYREIQTPDKKHHLLHIMLAKTFLPNPYNKPTVDHIDREIEHNWLSNVRWATYPEQAYNKYRGPMSNITIEPTKNGLKESWVIKMMKDSKVYYKQMPKEEWDIEDVMMQRDWIRAFVDTVPFKI